MPRKKSSESKIDVTGLSIESIMGMGFEFLNSLNSKDIKKITSRLVSAANKRIRRLKESEIGELSPALMEVEKSGRLFSVQGKNTNQVRAEFKRVSNFLKKKTSSIVGFKKIRKETMKRLGVKKWDVKDEKRYWVIYRRLVEETGGNDAVKAIYGSTNLQQHLYQVVSKDNNDDSVFEKMEEKMNQMYIEGQKRFEYDEDDEDDVDLDDIFTI